MPSSRNAVAALFVAMEGRFAKFDTAMQQASSKFARFSKKMDKIGNNLSKNLTVPLATLGYAALKATQQIDEAMDSIRISTGKTGEALSALQDDFRAVFTGKAASSAEDTSKAIGDLNTRLGLTGKPLQELATQLLVFSRLTKTNVSENVTKASQLFKSWNVATDQQSFALDQLYKAAEKGGIPVNSLLDTLTRYGPVLQTANFSMTDSISLLAQLEGAGIDTQTAMSGLQQGMKKMAVLGIKDIPAALRAMITDIKNAKSDTDGLSKSALIFGRAGVEMNKAIRSGKFDIDAFSAALQGSQGSIEAARGDTDGLSEQLTVLANKFIIAAEPLEGALSEGLKALEPVIQKVADGVNYLSQRFAELTPQWKAIIVGVVGLAGAAGPLALVLSGLSTGFSVLLSSVTSLISPWTVLAAAIGVMIALVNTPEFARGLQIIKDKFNELSADFYRGIDIVKATGTALKEDFLRGLQIVADTIGGLKDKIVAEFEAIYTGMKSALVDKVNGIYEDFQRGLDRIYNSVADLKKRLFDNSPFPEIEEGMEETFQRGGEAAITATTNTTDNIFKQWDLFAKKHKTQLGGVADTQKKLAATLDSAFTALERAIFDKATDPLDEFSKKLYDAIQRKDLPALKKLAKEFITTADKANDFATALGKATQKNEQFKADQEELRKVLSKLDRNFNDINNRLSESATKFKKLFQRSDIDGAKKYAQELLNTGTSLEEINTAMRDAREEMSRLKDEAYDSVSLMVDSFGKLAESFGAPSESIDGIVEALQKFLKIQQDIDNGIQQSSILDVFDQMGSLFSGKLDASGVSSLAKNLMGLAQAATAVLEPFLSMGKDGGANDLAQGVQGGLAAIGAVIGGYYGGPAGAAAGASAGSSLGAMIPGLTDTDSADHEGRKKVEQWIEDILKGQKQAFKNAGGFTELFNNDIIRGAGNPLLWNTNALTGDEHAFDNGNWAQSFKAMGDDAMRVFGGLGEALKQLLGITEDVGGQIGYILASTFAGNIDNARLLVQLLGVDFDQLSEALLKSAIKGQITWHQYAVELQGLQQAFEPGLVAVGDMTGAVDNLIESGGRGLLAIKSLRDLAIEATEAGVRDLDGLRAYLIGTGKYTTQQIEQIFSALQAGGITNLDQLQNAGDQALGLIVANLQTMGFEFKNVDQSIGDMNDGLDDTQNKVDGILQTIEQIPSEVHTKIVVDYQETGNSSGSSSSSSSQVQKSATTSTSNRLARTVASSVASTVKKTVTTTTSSSRKKKTKGPSKEEVAAAESAAQAVVQELAKVFPQLDFGTGDSFSLSHFQAFFADISTQFQALTGEAQQLGQSLGNALSSSLDMSSESAAKLINLIGVELAGSVDNARHYVAEMDLKFEDLTAGLVSLAEKGTITWGQFATQVQQVTDLFKPGITAAGAYAQALDNFWGSGGTGFDAIQSIRDMGIEALEAQIKTVDELKAALIATGRPVEQIEKLFAALAAQGITTTEQLGQLTDLQAGLVAGGAANAGFQFAAPAAPAAPAPVSDPEEDRLRQRLAEASGSNRKARQKALDDYLAKRKAEKGYAKGAILHNTTTADLGSHIARMAEFEPEVIAPLSKLGGFLPASAKRGMNGASPINVTYNVSAPNATPQTVQDLESMLRRVHDSAVKSSIKGVADMVRRGGGYANAIRGG